MSFTLFIVLLKKLVYRYVKNQTKILNMRVRSTIFSGLPSTKVSYIFFFRKSWWVKQSIKSHNVVFFLSANREKKNTRYFFQILSDFFFPVKVHMLFIQSIWDLCFFFRSPEKKSQHFHSFNQFCPKLCKIWTFTG